MTSDTDLFRLHEDAMAFMTDSVHGVAQDAWTRQSPCEDWSVRDVVNHITSENLWSEPLLEGRTVGEVGSRFDGDLLGDDPTGAWDRAAKIALAAFGGESVMQTTIHASFGDISGRTYLEQMISDLIIHGWDIRKGSGQRDDIPAGLVTAALGVLEPAVRSGQTSSVFADPVEIDEPADDQTRLLALTGRRR